MREPRGVAGHLMLAMIGLSAGTASAFSITEARVGAGGTSTYTALPGDALWEHASAQNFARVPTGTGQASVGYGPIIQSNAHASTYVGVNRIRFDASFAHSTAEPQGATFATGTTALDSSAWTRWYDTWTVVGDTPGAPVTIAVRGSIDYSLFTSLSWPDQDAFPTYDLSYSVTFQGANTVQLATADFNRLSGVLNWETSIDWVTGVPLLVGAQFFGESRAFNASSLARQAGCQDCLGSMLFDASSTARFDSIVVGEGYSIQSSSGLLRSINDGSGFLYDVPPPAPVPLPAAGWMLALGLLGMVRIGRSRTESA